MAALQKSENIVVIGAGIIGSTTAFYLSRHPSFVRTSSTITLIEASANGPAQGASGKAGGLVAKWAYPRELVDVSFQEHVKLAEEFNGKDRWGWRYVGCGNWEGRGDLSAGSGVGGGGQRKSLEKTNGLAEDMKGSRAKTSRKTKGLPDDLLWVRENFTDSYSPMAGPSDTAQVHPYLFTTSMVELAKENGVKLTQGRATSIDIENGSVKGVSYEDPSSKTINSIPATRVVLAAGAWSPRLLENLPISATRAHSITIRPKPSVTIAPYVLFTEISLPSGVVSPEIYARPDNEVYVCGPGDDSALPDLVDDVQVDQKACDSIVQQAASISDELAEGKVEKRQACFLPLGGPLVGQIKDVQGLYIATGHTCWGICNAPGTAKAVSELIMDGKVRCANLKKLEPSRYM